MAGRGSRGTSGSLEALLGGNSGTNGRPIGIGRGSGGRARPRVPPNPVVSTGAAPPPVVVAHAPAPTSVSSDNAGAPAAATLEQLSAPQTDGTGPESFFYGAPGLMPAAPTALPSAASAAPVGLPKRSWASVAQTGLPPAPVPVPVPAPAPVLATPAAVPTFTPAVIPGQTFSGAAPVWQPQVFVPQMAGPAPVPTAIPTNNSITGKDRTPMCVFFMRGTCVRSYGCRFRHFTPRPEVLEALDMRAWELEEIAAAEREANGLAPSSDSKSDSVAGLLRPVEDEESVLRPADDEAAAVAAAAALDEQLTPTMPDGAEGEDGPVPDGDDAKVAAMDGTEWRTTWAIPGVTTEELDDTLEYLEATASMDAECGICYEKVLDKGGRFGVLSGCCHSFCLNCIREWRGRVDIATEATRACPVCRVISFFVTPCQRLITDSSRKKMLIDAYHGRLSHIPCKHFNYGKSTCPFGTSCFYAHLNPDGTPAVAPVIRKRLDADGDLGIVKDVRLSDYFK